MASCDEELALSLVACHCDLPTIGRLSCASSSLSHRISSTDQVWRSICKRETNGSDVKNIAPYTDWRSACHALVYGKHLFSALPSETVFMSGDWRIWAPADPGEEAITSTTTTSSSSPSSSSFRRVLIWNESTSSFILDFPWDGMGQFRVLDTASDSVWTVWRASCLTKESITAESLFSEEKKPKHVVQLLYGEASIGNGWAKTLLQVCGGAVSIRLPSGSVIELSTDNCKMMLCSGGKASDIAAMCSSAPSFIPQPQQQAAHIWRSNAIPVRKTMSTLLQAH